MVVYQNNVIDIEVIKNFIKEEIYDKIDIN